jgi:hypothetical protein
MNIFTRLFKRKPRIKRRVSKASAMITFDAAQNEYESTKKWIADYVIRTLFKRLDRGAVVFHTRNRFEARWFAKSVAKKSNNEAIRYVKTRLEDIGFQVDRIDINEDTGEFFFELTQRFGNMRDAVE